MEDCRHVARTPPCKSPQLRPAAHSSAKPVDYRREDDRVKSLLKWPARDFMNVADTARSGLYYYGEGDKVCCRFCRVILGMWRKGADADVDHRLWSPSCPLLLERPVGNVPLLLADECYYCGGDLEDWVDDADVPWEQHALWFTGRLYLRTCKGEDFIDKVLKAKALQEDIPVLSGDHSEQCKICFANERNACFVSCGHLAACLKCAMSASTCPVCRKEFITPVKIYLS